ncbi:MAG: transposase, partial [Rhodospirillales bacterium]|nr:transposase [Rhodospirillales bacterium]
MALPAGWRRASKTAAIPCASSTRWRTCCACGYSPSPPATNLRHDPVFKMAVGRAPESGRPLCSQPAMSRLENTPSRLEVARPMAAMVEMFCASFARPPQSITPDIDDTMDEVHGRQQLSLFSAHYDARCFQPIHVCDAETGRPVAVIPRQGATPTGREVRAVLRALVRHIRRHWPCVR